MEIISGVERRRRWRTEDKVRIVAEAEEPGACFAQVARRYDIGRGLLWHWRRQCRSGELVVPAAELPGFVPVHVVADAPSPVAAAAPAARIDMDNVEIVLPDGLCLRVNAGIEANSLRRLLTVLRR